MTPPDPDGEPGPAAVVRRLWERMEARDWEGARATLADDLVVDYVHSGERFVGADRFIAMNQAYPEGWHIVVDDVIASGDRAVAHAHVSLGEVMSHCAQFSSVSDGLITAATELWVDEASQAPPAWRAPFTAPHKETT